MVENAVDDGVEPRPLNAKASIKAYIDVKLSIEASAEVKPSGVSKLRDHEVNITSFFLPPRIDG